MTSTSLPRNTNGIEDTGGAAAVGGRPPVLSLELVFLGRLLLVMHSTLIGYVIGYLPNQDSPWLSWIADLAN